MRKWIPVVAVLAVAVGVSGFAWTDRPKEAAAQGPEAPQTVPVTRTDLSDTQDFKGELGFGPARTVRGRKAGTITWLPVPGTEIGRGRTMYKVDDRPVVLFFGDTPLWRKVDATAVKGPDVKIVKDNLAALGYRVGRRNDTVTPAMTSAIKRWQKSLKVVETGVLDVGDVVVLPAKVRVEEISAELSGPADGEVMAVTAPGKAVTASVEVPQIGAFKRGAKVTVALPNGKEAAGTVGAISPATRKDDAEEQASGDKATVAVEVKLDDPATVGGLATGPVRIRIATETKRGVLAVPVTALLALREGGYGVQVREGGRSTLVAVQTGMFAGGLVEIRGGGIREGLPVVTTS